MKHHGKAHDIFLKKQYGQHFLRDRAVVDHMIGAVDIKDACVFEIGPGDGFLTEAILAQPIKRLWTFEIDSDWAKYIRETYKDERLTVYQENILDVDFMLLKPYVPWTILANLPYQITFPILHLFQQHRMMLKEGVIMVQEEVAQKITKTKGRGYGYPSLFFQYYFDWQQLDKVLPGAFYPPPKVESRLLYFKPKKQVNAIPDEAGFWRFIKTCFKQPRRTLRNNLMQAHYHMNNISDVLLTKRAQELDMQQLLLMWDKVRCS